VQLIYTNQKKKKTKSLFGKQASLVSLIANLYAFTSFWFSITFPDSVFMTFMHFKLVLLMFIWNYVFSGFGGSFMAPSSSPVTPAQNNLLQPNFEAAFGTTPSTSSSSSFDPSGEALIISNILFICFNNKIYYLRYVFRKFISKHSVIAWF
jgi:hypothetical protein